MNSYMQLLSPTETIACHIFKPLIGALTPTSPLSIFSQPLNPAEIALLGYANMKIPTFVLLVALHELFTRQWYWSDLVGLVDEQKTIITIKPHLKNAYASFICYSSTKIIKNNNFWVRENLMNRLG